MSQQTDSFIGKLGSFVQKHPNYTGAAVGTVVATTTIVALPLVLGAAGFTAAGIGSGTLAATAMAKLPVTIVAVGQSVGALGTVSGAVGGTTVVAGSAAYGAVCGFLAKVGINKTKN